MITLEKYLLGIRAIHGSHHLNLPMYLNAFPNAISFSKHPFTILTFHSAALVCMYSESPMISFIVYNKILDKSKNSTCFCINTIFTSLMITLTFSISKNLLESPNSESMDDVFECLWIVTPSSKEECLLCLRCDIELIGDSAEMSVFPDCNIREIAENKNT